MKKILAIALSVAMLLSLSVVLASATPGYFCGGSEDNFTPVGKIQIQYDPDAASKLDLTDGDMSDWAAAGYSFNSIGAENMISWVGGTAENQAAGMPEGWGIQTYFVADADYLYIGFYITDPDVILVTNATAYTGGDSFQFMVDFDRALGKAIDADPDLFVNPKCIFYSFGPMGEEATPIQIMRQESDNDGVISEENGDGVKGTTALTETGWCAEFALSWNQLYDDFEYKAYADDYECSVTEGDPLEVCCALYYLNSANIPQDDGSTSVGMTWAAGTLTAPEAGATPDVTWTPADNGIELYVEYSPELVFNCDRIVVYNVGETAPEQDFGTTEPDESESEPAESDSEPAESTPADSTPVESTPAESTPAESTPAESASDESAPADSESATDSESAAASDSAAESESEAEKSGCGATVLGSVAVLMSAMAAAVVLKKKD